MTPLPLRIAIALVRAWTRFYTWRLPPELRDARRAEVDSDLWESEHDADGAQPGFQIFARLLTGVADDLGWRFEQEGTMTGRFKVRLTVGILVASIAVLWVAASLTLSPRSPQPHAPPPTLRAGLFGQAPPPPPPPPPPPVKAGNTAWRKLQHVFGETSYTVADGRTLPVKVKDARPVYPPIAVEYELRGTVILEAIVGESGRVIAARVVKSIPVFDQSALYAVRQWEFQPTAVDGQSARVLITVTVRFGAPPAQ